MLAAGFLVLAELFSPKFQECVTQYNKNENSTSQDKNPTGFRVIPTVSCLGDFIDKNSGGLTALATMIIAAFTFTLWRATTEQGILTRDAINQARQASQSELRAYLSVTIGGAAYQERINHKKFAAYPMLKNNGRTPAYNVRHWGNAEIIPDALVENFNFQAHSEGELSQSTIGPNEDRIIYSFVPDWVNDAEIQDIRFGNSKALWAWGIVHYEDAFGQSRFVKYSQRLTWLENGQIWGQYGDRFGESN